MNIYLLKEFRIDFIDCFIVVAPHFFNFLSGSIFLIIFFNKRACHASFISLITYFKYAYFLIMKRAHTEVNIVAERNNHKYTLKALITTLTVLQVELSSSKSILLFLLSLLIPTFFTSFRNSTNFSN